MGAAGVGIELKWKRAEERPSFEAIYRAHHRYVWQTLRAFGVPEAAADDAVQDVFLVVHRRLGEFEGRSTVRTWLFEILRRVAWRYRTKAQREASKQDALPELAAGVDLEAELERTQALDVLQRFVAELDEDRLRVFVLSVFGELRGREIAEALGVNLNTVYARLRSANAALERFTTRLRAREASATLRAARASRPSPEGMRRTWATLAVQVGGMSQGGMVAGTVGASSAAWAWGSATAVAASLAAAAVLFTGPAPGEPSVDPVLAQTVLPDDPPPPASAELPVRAVSSVTWVERPAPKPKPARAVATRVAPAEPAAQRLAKEVAAVKQLQAAADSNGPVVVGVERYRREFPNGTLREEVDALEIEHLCRRGSVPSAEVSAFKRRWPHSTLLRPLEKSCGLSIPLQKPRRSQTPSP